MNTDYTKRFGIALMIAALSGGVIAAEPETSDADLLRGPEVVESSGPDAGDSMSGSSEASKRAGDMPFRAYLSAVRGLNKAAQDNPELALTDEQKEQLKEIAQKHREKMKAFMDEHQEELAEFRGVGGERGERGQRGQRGQRGAEGKERGQRGGPQGELGDKPQGERGDRPSPEEQQRMREKMGELMAQAPSDQEAKKQLWAVLTEDQQAAVKENIAEMRTQREQRIDEAMERGSNGKEGKEGKKGKERKGEPQGMMDNPIFDIDQPLPGPDDC
jgi:hypothetical protein